MSAHDESRDCTVDEPKSGRQNPDGNDQNLQQAVTALSSSITEAESLDSSDSETSQSSQISNEEDRLTAKANQIRYDCIRILPHVHAFQVATEKTEGLKLECEQLDTQLKRLNGPIEELGVPRNLLRMVIEKFLIDLERSSHGVFQDHVDPLSRIVNRTEWILDAVQSEERFDWSASCPLLSEVECEEAKELTVVVKAFEAEVDVLETTRELLRATRITLGWVGVE